MELNSQVMFSEGGSPQRNMPEWVQGMLRIGLDWPAGAGGPRRIGIVSMPCDSAAFGLIALGIMIRDLGRVEATDIHLHHQRVVDYARRYVAQQSSSEEIPNSQRLSGILKWVPKEPSKKPTKYQVVGLTGGPDYRVKVRQLQAKSKLNGSEPATVEFSIHKTQRLAIEGASIPEVRIADLGISSEGYQALVSGLHIEHSNLRQSYTGLCIAGRVEGERATRSILEQVAFHLNDGRHGVDELLQVEGWTDGVVGRVRFVNMRGVKEELRIDNAPDVIVVDGLKAFTRVITNPELRSSDVVMVYHRAVDRELLEELGSHLDNLQKYMTHNDKGELPVLPQPIHYSILEG